MGLGAEFKEFAMKGNVVDLAVGVIIGAAFGKIVSSLVGDIFMPALGKLIGGINFSDLAVGSGKDPAGKEVLIKYGAFLQTIFDFVIIALVLFMCHQGNQQAQEAGARGARRTRAAGQDPKYFSRKFATCSRGALKPRRAHILTQRPGAARAPAWRISCPLSRDHDQFSCRRIAVFRWFCPPLCVWADDARAASAHGRVDRQGAVRIFEFSRQQRGRVDQRQHRPAAL